MVLIRKNKAFFISAWVGILAMPIWEESNIVMLKYDEY